MTKNSRNESFDPTRSAQPARPSRISRRTVLTAVPAALALIFAGPHTAFAQSTQPIRLVVGYAPGGPVDSAARIVAPYLGRELGTTIIIENRPGAGGALGGDLVAKAPPNGQMLFFAASPTVTITPHVLKSMPFDPVKDLTAIAPILSYTNVLVANKDQPYKNVRELIAYAKANPGKVTYGSAGMGASNHLSGELFAMRNGIDLRHVPYKGSAPAMTDVIGGQISMMFDIVSQSRTYIAAGRVRPIAVLSRERNAQIPDVPTMAESGMPDFEVNGWYGLYGPAKMPADLLARINKATVAALANEELKRKLVENGYDFWSGTPQMLAERTARELALWGDVTKNIKF